MEFSKKELYMIARKFALKGDIVSIQPHGNGHINKTYKVVTTDRKYILQNINTNVFTNVEDLLNNIVRVSEHLLDKNLFTLVFKPTYDGKLYYEYHECYFRVYKFIDNSICYEGIDNLETVEKAGYAFGQLHCNLSDLDPSTIVDVIPNFHNTRKRYKDLLKAISSDPLDRVKDAKEMISFINSHRADFSLLTDGLDDGSIHNSITHNDPKINNVLFNSEDNQVKCVIDLDTVMTGSYLFDFGDALRSLFTGANEDSKDLSLLKVDFDVYKAYLTGYYSQMKTVLNKKEIELLPMSVVILTMELVIRFLTDYIQGDIYFGINYTTHNYDRAMTQYALAKDLYNNLDKLKEITNEVCK